MSAFDEPVSSDRCDSPGSTASILGPLSRPDEQMRVLPPHGLGQSAPQNVHQLVDTLLHII